MVIYAAAILEYKSTIIVNLCALFGCSDHGYVDKNKSFYCLPTVIQHLGPQADFLSSIRQKEGLAAINRSDIKSSNYLHTHVRSDHFVGGSPSSLYDTTNRDWVPSINMGYLRNASQSIASNAPARYSRAQGKASEKICIRNHHFLHSSSFY